MVNIQKYNRCIEIQRHTLGFGLGGEVFFTSDLDFFDFCGVSLDLLDGLFLELSEDDLCFGVPLCFFKPQVTVNK